MVQRSVFSGDRVPNPLRCFRHNRALILDYALASAILGLSPFFLTMMTVLVGLIALKMVWDIGRNWGFPQGLRLSEIAANLLSIISALAAALIAWATLTVIGFLIPLIGRMALSAAFFTLIWMLGNATNQHYLNICPLDDEPRRWHG